MSWVHRADENHHEIAPTPSYGVKVTEWCDITNTFVLCPNFLKDVTSSDSLPFCRPELLDIVSLASVEKRDSDSYALRWKDTIGGRSIHSVSLGN
ncbi:hypothetical protein NPIL_118091 [Nephila pilipes]|uniref:Uncharacterized protein n=1 Tax=Nephila pilipes TaxID=299642 RepID=A0A8X6ITZ4_NEPPI|nr:hypothetical protein NPIL_118091 [Nephila pilipes]